MSKPFESTATPPLSRPVQRLSAGLYQPARPVQRCQTACTSLHSRLVTSLAAAIVTSLHSRLAPACRGRKAATGSAALGKLGIALGLVEGTKIARPHAHKPQAVLRKVHPPYGVI